MIEPYQLVAYHPARRNPRQWWRPWRTTWTPASTEVIRSYGTLREAMNVGITLAIFQNVNARIHHNGRPLTAADMPPWVSEMLT